MSQEQPTYPSPSVEFLLSAPTLAHCPDLGTKPEFALVGRSNVGKSSLINRLTQRHRQKIAKTSNTPGKTRLINFYLIDDAWLLVDLPGYGYAKVSKTEQQDWQRNLERYLLERPTLAGVLQLVDARHGPQPNDREMNSWLLQNALETAVVLTKWDKPKKNEASRSLQASKALQADRGHLRFSAETGTGANELWRILGRWREEWAQKAPEFS